MSYIKVYQTGVVTAYDYKKCSYSGKKTQTQNGNKVSTVKNTTVNNAVNRANRVYRINRNKVRSSCIALFRQKTKKCLLFLTFTIPFDICEKKLAKIWKITLDQLRNQYGIKQYVWVKEYQCNGRLHYHILLDTDYIDIKELQCTYNSAIHHITGNYPQYNNSVMLGDFPRVYTIEKVKNYLSKYVTKAVEKKDTENKEPAWLTKKLAKQAVKDAALREVGIIDGEYSQKAYGNTEELVSSIVVDVHKYPEVSMEIINKSKKIFKNEYISIYLLDDWEDLSELFNNF